MACQHVGFENGSCLVEVSPDRTAVEPPAYTAFMFLVENDGHVIRPLVSRDGHRVRVRARSEPLAIGSAISYLEHRFGAVNQPDRPVSLGTATIGHPFTIDQ